MPVLRAAAPDAVSIVTCSCGQGVRRLGKQSVSYAVDCVAWGVLQGVLVNASTKQQNTVLGGLLGSYGPGKP